MWRAGCGDTPHRTALRGVGSRAAGTFTLSPVARGPGGPAAWVRCVRCEAAAGGIQCFSMPAVPVVRCASWVGGPWSTAPAAVMGSGGGDCARRALRTHRRVPVLGPGLDTTLHAVSPLFATFTSLSSGFLHPATAGRARRGALTTGTTTLITRSVTYQHELRCALLLESKMDMSAKFPRPSSV